MIKKILTLICTFVFVNLIFIFINTYKVLGNAVVKLDIINYLHYNFNFSILPLRYVMASLIVAFFVYLVLFNNSKTLEQYLKTILIFFGVILFLIVAVMFKTYHVYNYVASKFQTSDFYEKYYVDTKKAKIDVPKNKKNLIMIYIESMENSFANEVCFGKNLIPELSKIAKENISFSKYTEGYFQNNTQMALVASMSGLPSTAIYFNQNDNRHIVSKSIQQYLSNVYCLGDFLKDNGYETLFVQSGDLDFSGSRYFLMQHGFEQCYGQSELVGKIDNVDVMSKNKLGVQDKYTFEFFKKEILNYYKKNKPMCLVMATIDTHYYFYLSDNEKKRDISMSSKQIKHFIDWVNKEPFAKDTVIILVGDHLRVYDNLVSNNFEERYIYNAFINCAYKDVNKDRCFTQVDLFPTILEALGFKIEGSRLGIGTSLFSNRKTLIEEFGEKELDKQLSKSNKLYNSFWKN